MTLTTGGSVCSGSTSTMNRNSAEYITRSDDFGDNINGEFNYYSSDTDDDDDDESDNSLIPTWKDDDDDGDSADYDVNRHHCNSDSDDRLQRIPSTLEFRNSSGRFEELSDDSDSDGDGVGDNNNEYSCHHRSISFSVNSIDAVAVSIMVEQYPTPKQQRQKQEERSESPANFRRRPLNCSIPDRIFHQSTTRNDSTTTTNSTSASALPIMIRLPRSNNTLNSSPRRLVLMMGAIVLVMLSVHDSVQNSRQFYRQQYRFSDNRREEFAFPLNSETTTKTASTSSIAHDIFSSKQRQIKQNRSQYSNNVVELPKYSLPKLEKSSWSGTIRGNSGGSTATTTISSSSTTIAKDQIAQNIKRRNHRPNLAMAQSQQQARPIFVPDQPLPDGLFRKPLERFVFDPYQQQQTQQSDRDNGHSDYHYISGSSSSWTSWIVSFVLIGMIVDMGWKEYQRSCLHVILPRDE
mmetsp:Transcript_57188/g.65998  ORF Transcript_57188/g.65998 Transcript_57188/m.65998 type:complete len:463 (-) Transcript_57188:81-1469(-)